METTTSIKSARSFLLLADPRRQRHFSDRLIITIALIAMCLTLSNCATQSSSTHVYTSTNTQSERGSQGDGGQAPQSASNESMVVGAEQYAKYLPFLKGKRVSLVVNQSALVTYTSPSSAFDFQKNEGREPHDEPPLQKTLTKHYQHLLDALLQRNVNVVSIMSPEHGFRGDKGAGEKVNSDIDPKTGLPIYSLYGSTKKPTPDMLANTEVIIFDIQDVGVRFYTYLSTLHYVMEAAFAQGIHVIVLDRPNPNGKYVDGPVLKPEFKSFIGMHPIPVLHGMTLGELSQMIVGEQWLNMDENNYATANLTVVPVSNYKRTLHYSLPVAPSPNLPTDVSIRLYPTLCFFEGTDVSIGRGTDFPFQLIGHPDVKFGETHIKVKANTAAPRPKHENKTLLARRYSESNFSDSARSSDEHSNDKRADNEHTLISGLDIATLIDAYSRFSTYNDIASVDGNAPKTFFTRPAFFDKLAGTNELRRQIETGTSAVEIRQSWQEGLGVFIKKREPYLIYLDTD